MRTKLLLQRPALYLICGIVVTIPLIFGAVHPIVLGCYVFVMLVCLGGWLLLNPETDVRFSSAVWLVIPVVLICYIVFQSFLLPLDWVEVLSPLRAERVRMVNELAGTNQLRITLNEHGILGLHRSLFMVALMCYYFSLKRLFQHSGKSYFIIFYCLIGVGAFEALYGLMQFVSPHIGILWLSIKGRAAHGSIIYRNQYASFLNMIWPLAVAGSILYFMKDQPHEGSRKPKRERGAVAPPVSPKFLTPFCVFAVGLMILAVLFSLSRGGMLAMVVVALSLVVVLPFARRKKILFFSVFILLISSYGAMLGWDTIVSRFDSIGRSGTNRIDIYLASLPMLMDHWLTGIGLGSYTLLSPVYLKDFPVNIHYDRVHNEYLELMIELGIPMAILLFCWLAAGMTKVFFCLRSSQMKSECSAVKNIIGLAAFCGLIGFFLHGVVDFGWRLPVNLVYGVTLFALVVGSLEPETDSIEE